MEPGTRIGPYQITGKIGEGGMGEVYRARDTKLSRDVALKGCRLASYAQLIRPDGRPVASQPLDGPGAPQIANGALVWSPDGKRLAASSLSGTGVGSAWIIEPDNPVPYKKLLDLPAGEFIRGMTWSSDGASLIVGRYRWSGDIFLAERSAR